MSPQQAPRTSRYQSHINPDPLAANRPGRFAATLTEHALLQIEQAAQDLHDTLDLGTLTVRFDPDDGPPDGITVRASVDGSDLVEPT